MLTSTSSEMATRRRRITSTVTGSIAVAAGAAFGAGLASMIADNVDLSELPDGERVTGTNNRARSILDNKSWALTVEARLQRITIIDLGGQKPILFQEKDRPRLQLRRLAATVRPSEPSDVRPVHVQGCERVHHDNLNLCG